VNPAQKEIENKKAGKAKGVRRSKFERELQERGISDKKG